MPTTDLHRTLRHLACAALAAVCLAPAHADNSIAANYTRTTAGESVVAPFAVLSTATAGVYAGPVEVLVSGTGFSLGNQLNDAFYFVGGEITYGFYMLNIGWDNAPLLPSNSGRVATNFITFVDNVGQVALGSRPVYAADHVYRFVIDVPPAAGPLRFGVSDGNFGDNGGAYDVSVWQLQASAVPEPGVAALWLTGLGLVASLRGRAQRT